MSRNQKLISTSGASAATILMIITSTEYHYLTKWTTKIAYSQFYWIQIPFLPVNWAWLQVQAHFFDWAILGLNTATSKAKVIVQLPFLSQQKYIWQLIRHTLLEWRMSAEADMYTNDELLLPPTLPQAKSTYEEDSIRLKHSYRYEYLHK